MIGVQIVKGYGSRPGTECVCGAGEYGLPRVIVDREKCHYSGWPSCLRFGIK